MLSYSIVIPAYNEADGIGDTLKEIFALRLPCSYEVIVVNDASKDNTAEKAKEFGIRLINNVQNSGYGYSLKHGIQSAVYENIIILDADGTYPVSSIPEMINEFEKGYDMVVGARQGKYYHGTLFKRVARFFFKKLSEFTSGRKIPDINSGFRVFRKDVAIKFFKALSSGFSFTTTITLAFMLNSYSVKYLPVPYQKRAGSSKVRYVRDTLRSAQIIIEAIVLYNPLKLFLLLVGFLWCAAIVTYLVVHFYDIWLGLIFFVTFALSLVLFGFGCTISFFRLAGKDVHKLN